MSPACGATDVFLPPEPNPHIRDVSSPRHEGSPDLSLATTAYGPFGEPDATNSGRFQYTGQTWIGGASLYYYKARFYDPKLKRFLSPDPIGYGDGMNIYAYVGGDPINSRDPWGLFGVDDDQDDPCKDDDEDCVGVADTIKCDEGWVCYSPDELFDLIGGQLIDFAHLIDFRCNAEGCIATFDGSARANNPDRDCSPAISGLEAVAFSRGNLGAFWDSRYARGDGWAHSGQGLWSENGSGYYRTLGNITRSRLRGGRSRSSFSNFSPDFPNTPGLSDGTIRSIGIGLAEAHIFATEGSSSNNMISHGIVADYHHRVFASHGVAASRYGGTPFGALASSSQSFGMNRIFRFAHCH